MAQPIQPIIYHFGLEEVAFLLQAMKLSALPGVNLDRFNALNKDQKSLVLAAADRSLRAKNTVRRTQGLEREIGADVVGTFSEYANANTYCELKMLSPKPASPITYAINSKFTVEHLESDPDVHQFTTIYSDANVLTYIERFLPTQLASGKGAEFTINRIGSVKPQQILSFAQSKLAKPLPQMASEIQDAIIHPQTSLLITLNTHNTSLATFILIQGNPGLYCLEKQNDQLVITPLSGDAIHPKMDSLLHPYLQSKY
jgi:hypothetical protein